MWVQFNWLCVQTTDILGFYYFKLNNYYIIYKTVTHLVQHISRYSYGVIYLVKFWFTRWEYGSQISHTVKLKSSRRTHGYVLCYSCVLIAVGLTIYHVPVYSRMFFSFSFLFFFLVHVRLETWCKTL